MLPRTWADQVSGVYDRPVGPVSSGTSPGTEPCVVLRLPDGRKRMFPAGTFVDKDKDFIMSLMYPVLEVGKIANWIAPPAKGIKDKPFEFEYVRR